MKKKIIKLLAAFSLITTLMSSVFALGINEAFIENGVHYQVTSDSQIKVTKIDNIELLQNITIPTTIQKDGVEYTVSGVEYNLFNDAKTLKTLTIPDTLTDISGICNSITDNFLLEEFNIISTANDKEYYSKDGVVFKETMLYFFPKAKGGEYTLPDTIDSIEENAFLGAYKLEKFNIPASYPGNDDFLKKSAPEMSPFLWIKDGGGPGSPIQYISSLKEVSMIGGDTSISNLTVKDGILYKITAEGKKEIRLFPMLWQGSIYSIPTDASPDAIIDEAYLSLFYAPNLSEIICPETVVLNGFYVYEGCLYVTKYDDYAVIVPRNMETVKLSKEFPDITVLMGLYVMTGTKSNIKEIIVNSENPYLSSDDGIVFNKDKTSLLYYPEQKEDTSYTIKDGITSIGEGAFISNTYLRTLIIPETVTKIEAYAFQDSHIEYMYIHGNTLTDIDRDIFISVDESGNFNSLGNIKALYYEDSAILQSLIDTVGPEIESIAFDGTITTATMNDDVKAIKNEDNTVTITWSGDSDGYEIRRYNSKARSTYTVAGTVEGTTTFTDKDVQEGENVAYAVVPYNYSNSRSTFETDPFKDRKEYGEEKRAKKEVYIEKNYTVTFIGKDGSILKEETVREKGSATPPKAPEIEGYTFDKWDKGYTNVNSDLVIQTIYKENQKPEEIPPNKEEENQPEDKITFDPIVTDKGHQYDSQGNEVKVDEKGAIVDTSDTTSIIELLGLMVLSGMYLMIRKRT